MRELVSAIVLGSFDDAIDRLEGADEKVSAHAWDGATTLERAAIGGLLATKLGLAFAVGYREALRRLVPSLGMERAALSITERGGGHPRAIESTLTPDGDGFLLSGHKKWATMAHLVDVLFVVASLGDRDGKKDLRLVRVDAKAAGVTFRAMPPAPFCPEIEHAEVDLDRVRVGAADVLLGDGFEAYSKPFRTIEDLHITAAALGFIAGQVRRFGADRGLVDRAAAMLVLVEAIGREDPSDAATHLALAGALANAAPIFEAVRVALGALGDDGAEAARLFERDLPLLTIAGNVRAARTTRALETLAKQRGSAI
jgi:acyl-CoA dehydrogenase